MRSTNATESDRCDPPNPRLMTLCRGKTCARFVQSRMVELPINRLAPRGGGLVLSASSNALISFPHRSSGDCFPSPTVWADREGIRTVQLARDSQVFHQTKCARIKPYCEATCRPSKVLF